MKLPIASLFLGSAIFFITSCGSQDKPASDDTDTTAAPEEETEMIDDSTAAVEMEKDGLKIYPVTNSPEWDNAKLTLKSPDASAALEPGETTFEFEVSNYELATQTSDADAKMCANSAKGQHIHFILNNQPYNAIYEPEITKELDEGHHVVLAFLSRSYHESLKNEEASTVFQVTVGEPEGEPADLSAPHMFYSRPKGTYSGDATKKILFDFYLANIDLAKDGAYVTATFNDTSFDLYNWQPYFVEGLPMDTTTVKIELKDAEGNLIDSPFNPTERKIVLTEATE